MSVPSERVPNESRRVWGAIGASRRRAVRRWILRLIVASLLAMLTLELVGLALHRLETGELPYFAARDAPAVVSSPPPLSLAPFWGFARPPGLSVEALLGRHEDPTGRIERMAEGGVSTTPDVMKASKI